MEGFIESLKNFFSASEFLNAGGAFLSYLCYFTRYMLPVAAIAVLTRCARSMFREKYEPEVWAYLDLPDGSRVPVRNWEITIGSSASGDVCVNDPEVSGTQLVLIRDEKGNWTVFDVAPLSNTGVNGVVVPEEGAQLADGDTLTLGKSELRFFNLTEQERAIIAKRRTSPGKQVSPSAMFFYVSIFQIIIMFQQLLYAAPENMAAVGLAFTALFAAMWLYFIFMRSIGRRGFEIEAIAFLLSTIGLSVAASSNPQGLLKHIILLMAGILSFVVLGWWLRDLKRVKALRLPAAACAVALLAVNLLFGSEYFGAKNWLSLGGFSFQPSEFVKIVYVYAGAATMDRLYRGRNLLLYIAFSAICVGALALMGDFGTALVFFATFLVISFMRSGNIGTVLLAVTGAALAGVLALSIKPHIAQRFATWGHVWEDIYGKGYQQTRAMSAAASGGLFGMGSGNGWLHGIIAADTDLVFEVVCEELGVIVALCAVAAIVMLAFFMVRNAAAGRSSFYVIAGTAAISLMMVQMALNVFGSLDILPFTGVTFPFVSVGGSSLISCWALLAFIKAADTRKNASFAIKSPNKIHDCNEFSVADEAYEEDQEPYIEDVSRDCSRNGRNLFDRRGERGRRDDQ